MIIFPGKISKYGYLFFKLLNGNHLFHFVFILKKQIPEGSLPKPWVWGMISLRFQKRRREQIKNQIDFGFGS